MDGPVQQWRRDITAWDTRHIETDVTDNADGQWTETEDIWTTGDGDLRHALNSLTNGTEDDVQVRAVNVATTTHWRWRGTPPRRCWTPIPPTTCGTSRPTRPTKPIAGVQR